MATGTRFQLITTILLMLTVGVALVALAPAAQAGGPSRAREALAIKLDVLSSSIEIARSESVEFSDGCMGLRATGHGCSGRISSIATGNVTWLVIGDEAYRYHGSEEFRALQLAAGPFPASEVATAPLPAGVRPIVSGLPATGSGGLADGGRTRPVMQWAGVALIGAMAVAAGASVYHRRGVESERLP